MKRILIKKILMALAMSLLSTASAHAQADVILAVDLSGTMRNNDPKDYRYDGADQFLTLFSIYGSNRAGVISFGNSASEVMPFNFISRDRAGKYRDMFTGLKLESWTELGKGLELGRNILGTSQDRTKSIVVISDGIVEGNPDVRAMGQEQAKAAAERDLWERIVPDLKSRGIRVFTIGLLSRDTQGEPTLQMIASKTGGFYTRVNKPEEFSKIFKKMLDEIDQPAGVVSISRENNKVVLTPADEGVIITGPQGFSIVSPNGRAYPNKDNPTDSTAKQLHVTYSDGSAILFLRKPDNEAALNDNWTGEWAVEINGAGQATYISSVRFNRGDELTARSEYFLNEYIPIRFNLTVKPSIDSGTKAMLDKCTADYTVVRADQRSNWTRAGQLKVNNYEFTGEQLVDQEGTYLLEIQMSCGNLKYRTIHENFSVSAVELISLTIRRGHLAEELQSPNLEVGERFTVMGEQNPETMTKDHREIRGLKDAVLNLEFQYESGTPRSIKGLTSADGKPVSDELEFEDSGDLTLEGIMNGTLIAQQPGNEGLSYYPVKAKTKRVLHGSRSITKILERGLLLVGLVISPFITLFVFVRQRQWKSLKGMSLLGRNIDEPLAEANLSWINKIKRAAHFKSGPYFLIGGPLSNAELKLPSGGDEIIAEIGEDNFSRFYILRRGDRNVYLHSTVSPIPVNKREPINPGDKIIVDGIGEMKFEPPI